MHLCCTSRCLCETGSCSWTSNKQGIASDCISRWGRIQLWALQSDIRRLGKSNASQLNVSLGKYFHIKYNSHHTWNVCKFKADQIPAWRMEVSTKSHPSTRSNGQVILPWEVHHTTVEDPHIQDYIGRTSKAIRAAQFQPERFKKKKKAWSCIGRGRVCIWG